MYTCEAFCHSSRYAGGGNTGLSPRVSTTSHLMARLVVGCPNVWICRKRGRAYLSLLSYLGPHRRLLAKVLHDSSTGNFEIKYISKVVTVLRFPYSLGIKWASLIVHLHSVTCVPSTIINVSPQMLQTSVIASQLPFLLRTLRCFLLLEV